VSERPQRIVEVRPEQQAIRDRGFHPSGTFIEFKQAEIEQTLAKCLVRRILKELNSSGPRVSCPPP
jgi:hypothetical protein